MAFCSTCQCTKPKDQFGKNSRRKDGISWYCKSCAKKHSKEHNDFLRPGKYGITPEELAALEVRAGGACEICGKRAPTQIDHDHQTGFVRGLLCRRCNTSLGQFGDTINGLRRAVDYLEYAGDNPIGVGAENIQRRRSRKFRRGKR
jgi:hypothetical protein